MKKQELQKNQRQVQQHLVVWVVLTIVLQLLTVFIHWPFVQYVAWLVAGYCAILIVLWCYLEWRILHLS